MSTVHLAGRSRTASRYRAHGGRGVLLPPLAAALALVLGAVGYVAYVLWPRWPDAVAIDAPAIPITVAGVAFNIPPAAIRVPVQRRAGAHERVDLAFLWPSLDPPDPNAKAAPPAAGVPAPPTKLFERVFVTISTAGDTLPPDQRVKTIYPRYATSNPVAGPGGLAVLAFREGTPYQGEDLIYDGETPANFLVRCSRNGAGPTPGTCLYDYRIDAADVVVRFPREWLADWRDVAANLERLIKKLRPPGS